MNFIETKLLDNKEMNKFMTETKRELDKFFGFSIDEPIIFLLNSRDELDIMWGKKTEDWLVAFVRHGVIFILRPEIFSEQSSHKNPGEFWQVLKHELCHIYFKKAANTIYPTWLNEGLANYLAGQEKRGGEPMGVFDYFDRGGNKVYNVGYFWVVFLIKQFGKSKILQLIKSLDAKINKKTFAMAFYGVYGFRFNKSSLSRILKS